MSKRLLVIAVGVLSVLGLAAYLSLKSQPKPAETFQVTAGQVPPKPAPAGQGLQVASPAPASSQPVIQQARLPENSPGVMPAAESGRRSVQFHSGGTPVPRLRPAIAAEGSRQNGLSASEFSSAAPAGGPAKSGTAEASNLGPGPGIVAAGNSRQPDTAVASPEAAPVATPASASAMLSPAGSVLLNGHPAIASTALFPGDQVQVPAGSYASINSNGLQATLQPGSSVVFTGKALDLRQGGIAVSTSRGTPVETEGLNIAPRAGQGKYDVLDDEGSVQIASLQGDLSIMGAGQPMTLAAGQQTTVDKRKAAAALPDSSTAPDTPPPTASGGFPTGKVLLITGAVAGGVVAAVLLTRSSSKPVSPAAP